VDVHIYIYIYIYIYRACSVADVTMQGAQLNVEMV
jgi:hypothetical protein